MQSMLTSTFQSSCLSFLSAQIIGVQNYTRQYMSVYKYFISLSIIFKVHPYCVVCQNLFPLKTE